MTGRVLGLRSAHVHNALENVSRALGAIEDDLATLAHRVERVQAQWSGEARDAFAEAMQECTTTLTGLQQIGAALTRVAQGSVARIEDFDRRRASAWHR